MKKTLTILLITTLALTANQNLNAQTALEDAVMLTTSDLSKPDHQKWADQFFARMIKGKTFNYFPLRITHIDSIIDNYFDTFKLPRPQSVRIKNYYYAQYGNRKNDSLMLRLKSIQDSLNQTRLIDTFWIENHFDSIKHQIEYKYSQDSQSLTLKLQLTFLTNSIELKIVKPAEKNTLSLFKEEVLKQIKSNNKLINAMKNKIKTISSNLEIEKKHIKEKKEALSTNKMTKIKFVEKINLLSTNMNSYINFTSPSQKIKFPTTQSEAIDQLAILIVSKFKHEVALTFFEKMKALSDSFPILVNLFENTSKLLKDQNSYEIPKLGSNWQYAFAKDIANLTKNIAKINWHNSRLINLDSNTIEGIKISSELMSSIIENGNISEAIIEITSKYPLSKKESIYLQSLRLASIFCEEFEIHDLKKQDSIFIKLKTLNSIQIELFLKLLYAYNIDVLDNISKEFKTTLQTKSESIIQNIIKLQKNFIAYKNIYNNSKADSSFNSILATTNQFLDVSSSFLSNSFSLYIQAVNPNDNIKAQILKTETIFEHFKEISKNLERKDYGMMVMHAFKIIDEFKIPKYSDYISKFKDYLSKQETLKDIYTRMDQIKLIQSWSSNEDLSKLYWINQIDKFGDIKDLSNLNKFNNQLLIKLNKDTIEMLLNDTGAINNQIKALREIWYTQLSGQSNKIKPIKAQTVSFIGIKLYKKEYKDINLKLTYSDFISAFDTLTKAIENDSILNSIVKNNTKSTLSTISEYAAFIVDLLKSKNSDELTEVVMTYAAETGSYKFKKEHRMTISINSFVGAFGGFEWKRNTVLEQIKSRSKLKNIFFASGLTVPIGLNFSFSYRDRQPTKFNENSPYFISRRGKSRVIKRNGYYGFTLNILDIVGPFSYRFSTTNDGEGLPADLKFEQILAPGFLFHWSFRNSPFSFTAGAQINPQLRKLAESPTFQNTSKIYIGILFDLPLYYVYKKPVYR